MVDYIRDLRPAKWGSGVSLQGSNPGPLMSALGQKQTLELTRGMSALCQKRTFCAAAELALFDHFVGAGEQRWRHPEAERLRSDQVDD